MHLKAFYGFKEAVNDGWMDGISRDHQKRNERMNGRIDGFSLPTVFEVSWPNLLRLRWMDGCADLSMPMYQKLVCMVDE